MRDNIGKIFTLKEVKFNFRKVCLEFWKRIDPNLPYFYHTSAHHRFSEGILPDFDQPRTSKRKSRFSRVPQREQPAAFVPGQATLPVRGSLSIRPQFHNKPLDLPPPPTAPLHVWEHSHAQHSWWSIVLCSMSWSVQSLKITWGNIYKWYRNWNWQEKVTCAVNYHLFSPSPPQKLPSASTSNNFLRPPSSDSDVNPSIIS